MTEQEFLIHSFRKNFEESKNKNIVIYGISNNTKIILDEFKEYNILGLMDGYQTEGELYGKKILSQQEVLSLKTDIIVIVARASSTKIVFKRISDFCTKNDIKIYDVNGNDLLKKLGTITEDSEYFKKNSKDLLGEIDSHDVISFDIFDTLIMRKVLFPADVFEMVEKRMDHEKCKGFEFAKSRVLAEMQLLSGSYPTFESIYNNLQKNVGLLDSEKKYLMELEFQIEKEVLIKREKMLEIYNYALKMDKEVYLVSDMYLTKDKMEEILSRLNITGYRDIIISCEYGTMKTQGLFGVLKNRIENKTCLHIGDNFEADILSARENNIDAYEIKSARDMLMLSSYRELFDNTETLSKRTMSGLFISKAFNDPFILYSSDGRKKVVEYDEFGYLFVAPIISEFLSWFIKNMEKTDYTKILFLARDGYLLEKLYLIAKDYYKKATLPEAVYFLTSRIACIAATMYGENDIKKAVEIGYDGTSEELLKSRFLLRDFEIIKDKEGNAEEFIAGHYENILKRSSDLRENYLEYGEKMGITREDKLAVFDLAASGTCQLCLMDIFKNRMDGYYFVNIKDDNKRKEALNINSLYKIDTWFSKEAFICESYILLESILTSKDPSLQEFEKMGVPIFVNEKRTFEQLEDISRIQKAITDYYIDYLELGLFEEENINLADKILSFVQTKYTDVSEISMIKDRLHDEFFNRTYSFGDILD